MTDLLNDFIKQNFGGKKPLLDQLNDEMEGRKRMDEQDMKQENIGGK
jgi:hypothetical protein